ncbi:MAG: PPC domain-containing protein [Bryobacteraceae bacterium]
MRLGAIRLGWLGAIVASAALGAPSIEKMQPRGCERGKAVTVVLRGDRLTPGARIETTIPGAISVLAPSKDAKEGAEFPLLVELRKDAPVGLYPLRLVTEEGLSNVVLFSVGALPEVEEDEAANPKAANGTEKNAQKLKSVPATINGTLTAADVDVFAFPVASGSKLVFEAEAAAAGSAIDPAIEVLDATGKTIAHNDDAEPAGVDSRLEHVFARAGTYYVRIHDSKYSAQRENFYRLKIGSYPYHEAMFPLGGRRGDPATVELIGGNLPRPVRVSVDTSARRQMTPVALEGSASLPALFELGDKRESVENESDTGVKAIEPGTIVNGRIGAKGEIDKYRLAVKPGEEWIAVVTAASTGVSFLDALVTVTDGAGKKIESRDDLGGADPAIPFTAPKDVREVIIAVEDLQGRGGPGYGYRLEARREPADFEVSILTPYVNVPPGGTAIVQARIQRRGYDGGMQVWIEGLPAGFSQAGGTVAPAAAAQRFDDANPRFSAATSTITISADAGVAAQTANLRVMAIADLSDGGRIVREGVGPGLVTAVRGGGRGGSTVTARWLGIGLALGVDRPLGSKLTTPVPRIRIAQGGEYPLRWKLAGGVAKSTGLRSNVATQVGNLRINQTATKGPDAGKEPEKKSNEGVLYVNTNFATPIGSFDFLPQVSATVGGQAVDVYAPMVTFDVAPGYQVMPGALEWKLAPGGAVEIAGRVHREPTFEGGLVKIEVQDLPEGVSCASLDVPATEAAFVLKCTAGAATAKGAYDVRLVSQAPDTGLKTKDTYKGPEVTGKLRIE